MTPCEVYCCICKQPCNFNRRYGRLGACCCRDCYREFDWRRFLALKNQPYRPDPRLDKQTKVKLLEAVRQEKEASMSIAEDKDLIDWTLPLEVLSKRLKTRHGDRVTICATDVRGEFPILGIVHCVNDDKTTTWTTKGRNLKDSGSHLDLVLATEAYSNESIR